MFSCRLCAISAPPGKCVGTELTLDIWALCALITAWIFKLDAITVFNFSQSTWRTNGVHFFISFSFLECHSVVNTGSFCTFTDFNKIARVKFFIITSFILLLFHSVVNTDSFCTCTDFNKMAYSKIVEIIKVIMSSYFYESSFYVYEDYKTNN